MVLFDCCSLTLSSARPAPRSSFGLSTLPTHTQHKMTNMGRIMWRELVYGIPWSGCLFDSIPHPSCPVSPSSSASTWYRTDPWLLRILLLELLAFVAVVSPREASMGRVCRCPGFFSSVAQYQKATADNTRVQSAMGGEIANKTKSGGRNFIDVWYLRAQGRPGGHIQEENVIKWKIYWGKYSKDEEKYVLLLRRGKTIPMRAKRDQR